jgi:hypothetical protein
VEANDLYGENHSKAQLPWGGSNAWMSIYTIAISQAKNIVNNNSTATCVLA